MNTIELGIEAGSPEVVETPRASRRRSAPALKRRLSWARGTVAPGRKVHFIGIGGAGMSGLARVMARANCRVSGSDLVDGDVVRQLTAAGIPVVVGHDAGQIPDDAECVVYSAAIAEDNPELVRARQRGLVVRRYSEALADLAEDRTTVAVAGTHGKTTTAAMLAFILREADLDPGAVIGGVVPQLGGSAICGSGDPFVVEACEYKESFHAFTPEFAVLTNVAGDHLEHFGTLDRVRAAFREFAARVERTGILVTSAAVAKDLDLRGVIRCRLLTLGRSRHDIRVDRLDDGFRLRHPDGEISPLIPCRIPGAHNVDNAALAAVIAHRAFDVDYAVVADAMGRFTGVQRRFEILVDRPGVALVDDFAHHPDEIEATLLAVRERFPGRRIIAAFQPHLDARTRRHFPAFLNALALSDAVVLARDYHVAGREEIGCDGARRLYEALSGLYMPSWYARDVATCVERLERLRRLGDVVVVMGAGDVREVSVELARRLS